LNPVLLIFVQWAAILGPLWTLAHWGRIYPARRLVYAALVPGVASLGLVASTEFRWVVVAIDGLLGLTMVVDLLTLPRARDLSAERDTGRIVSLRKPHHVSLLISNHSPRPVPLEVRDGVPEELRADPSQFQLVLAGRSQATLRYAFRPTRRGAFSLSTVHLRVASRLGLWSRMLKCRTATSLHVYPDMQQLSQYALLARTNRLSLLGVRRTRRIGQDQDFERLRDYAIDDNYRHIDWRATARRQKLTVKDFQATQSQRIVFLVDCGRMMVNEAAGLSLLDHSLNAILMLSYVALRQNDAVGLICFSDEIHGFVPPRGGMGQMNRLLHACYDRFPRLVESRYDQAFRYVATHCRKRSLVVLMTNVIDEVNASQVDRYLSNLVGRHLPLGVLLRDRRLFAAADAEEQDDDALWRAAAAADILLWRRQVLADMQAKGVLALDVFPDEMTAPLVNRYLQVKARHLL
jgi:uncharacterized protein (DUF58 family)